MTHATSINRKGLKFRGALGDFDVYEYFKGNRAVFEVAINRTDPELKIHVGKVGATWVKVEQLPPGTMGVLFETVGHARLTNDGSRVSSDSVKSYVGPRAFSILANLFVAPAPKPVNLPYIPVVDTTTGAVIHNDDADGDDTDEV
jgi:hypothetical protein